MKLVASLPMYRTSDNGSDWDALWSHFADALRAGGVAAPHALTHPDNLHDHWRDPALLLSQSCALPYRRYLTGKVQILASIDFGLADSGPGDYYSVIVARAGRNWSELRETGRPAVNDVDSQSGANVLTRLGIDLSSALITGAHAASATAVADGEADYAAIDAQSWRLIQKTSDMAATLDVVHHTKSTPGLPLITGLAQDVDAISAALQVGLANSPPDLLMRLDIVGLHLRGASDYADASAF